MKAINTNHINEIIIPGSITLLSNNGLPSGAKIPLGIIPRTGHISLAGIEGGHIHHKRVFASKTPENTINIHEIRQADMPEYILNIMYNGISHRNTKDNNITASRLPVIPMAVPDIFPDINIPAHSTMLAKNNPAE